MFLRKHSCQQKLQTAHFYVHTKNECIKKRRVTKNSILSLSHYSSISVLKVIRLDKTEQSVFGASS